MYLPTDLLVVFLTTGLIGCQRAEPVSPAGHPARKDAPDSLAGSRVGEEREIAGIKVCWCPADKFTMGSPRSEPERRRGEDQSASASSPCGGSGAPRERSERALAPCFAGFRSGKIKPRRPRVFELIESALEKLGGGGCFTVEGGDGERILFRRVFGQVEEVAGAIEFKAFAEGELADFHVGALAWRIP